MEVKNGRLFKTVVKEKEWITFDLENGQSFRMAIKDNDKDKRKANILIECPKNIKITTEFREPNGNH